VSEPAGAPVPKADGLGVAEERVKINTDPLALPTKGQLRLYRTVRVALLGVSKLWFRVEVHGREHVPDGEAFILAPVHRSNIDFLLSLWAMDNTRMRYLAKDTLWKGAWGRLWSALGAIPVHRGTPDRDALKTCIGVIKNGEPLVIFPEGTRQQGPEVQPLFDGPAYVQGRTGACIVPVGIGGSETAMPKGAKFIKPHKVVLVVGEPLAPPPKGESGRVPRSAVRDQTLHLHTVLQDLFDEAQQLAGTPNSHPSA
jgi:1-acyl-sn-glycerol-3-phosphate acyltransferase